MNKSKSYMSMTYSLVIFCSCEVTLSYCITTLCKKVVHLCLAIFDICRVKYLVIVQYAFLNLESLICIEIFSKFWPAMLTFCTNTNCRSVRYTVLPTPQRGQSVTLACKWLLTVEHVYRKINGICLLDSYDPPNSHKKPST